MNRIERVGSVTDVVSRQVAQRNERTFSVQAYYKVIALEGYNNRLRVVAENDLTRSDIWMKE